MLALRQAISAVVGDPARIVWNVCGVSGPADVGVPANNIGGVSVPADVGVPANNNGGVGGLADVGVPANINSGVSGPAVVLPLAGTPTSARQ